LGAFVSFLKKDKIPARGLAAPQGSGLARLRHNKWLRGGMNLIFLIFLVQGIGSFQTRAHPSDISLAELSLPRLDGPPLSFASFKGKPTMVAFFAPWCGVCKAQAQNLRWTGKILGDRAQVVTVAASYQDLASVRAYAKEHEAGLPVLVGGDALAARLKVSAFPTIFFLDSEGRVKHSSAGYTTTAGMVARLLF